MKRDEIPLLIRVFIHRLLTQYIIHQKLPRPHHVTIQRILCFSIKEEPHPPYRIPLHQCARQLIRHHALIQPACANRIRHMRREIHQYRIVHNRDA